MNLFRILKKIKPFVLPYKRLIIGTLVLTAIGSFAVQVNAIILRKLVDELTNVINGLHDLNYGYKMLLVCSAILIGKEIVLAFIQFGQKFFGEKLRIYVSRDISQLIVDRILTYHMAFYTSDDNDSGKLQTRIDQGISSITRLIQNFFIDILPLFANAIVALIFIYSANVYVGLVSTAMIPLYFYVSQRQATKLKGFRRKMRSYRENKNNGIISLINSITVIKSFVREPLEAEKHEAIQYDMTENQLQTRRMSFVFDAVKGFIEQFGLVVIILLTAYFVLKGEMTVGAIMFHVLLFNNVTAPIRQLHRIYDDVNDAMIYSESFFEIVDSEHEVESTGTYIPKEVKGKIEIKNVTFDYPNGTTALKDVSMTIVPNETTALVGLSGAGKSTVINLLDKFYAPTKGQIYIDGVDLALYDTKELRKHIGLVLQKNHIFQGSIEENIRYGNPLASFEEVEQAAKQAYIHEQIMDLPQGYQADARLLSGGQQQRIAIARLFLKDPAIIFLDEPTASLDAIATEQIKLSLDAIKENRTVIIVSHSISQIIDSHNIIVMEKGQVIESGTHEVLYDNKSTYYDIFSAMANSLNLDKISHTLNQDE